MLAILKRVAEKKYVLKMLKVRLAFTFVVKKMALYQLKMGKTLDTSGTLSTEINERGYANLVNKFLHQKQTAKVGSKALKTLKVF